MPCYFAIGKISSLQILFSVVNYELIAVNKCFFFLSAVVCPKLSVPDNGAVVPSSCSLTDVEYGTRCVFYCGDGYALSGPRYTTCQDDTTWSEIAPLSCVRGQFFPQRVVNSFSRCSDNVVPVSRCCIQTNAINRIPVHCFTRDNLKYKCDDLEKAFIQHFFASSKWIKQFVFLIYSRINSFTVRSQTV